MTSALPTFFVTRMIEDLNDIRTRIPLIDRATVKMIDEYIEKWEKIRDEL